MSAQVTLMGTIAEPSFRFTQTGKAVCSFSMVTKRSSLNRETNKWEEHDETWWQVTAWEKLAENCAETLAKGMDVIVVGRAFTETYTGRDGTERTALKVQASAVGPDLRRATAAVKRIQRQQVSEPAAPESDPWAAKAPGGEELPF